MKNSTLPGQSQRLHILISLIRGSGNEKTIETEIRAVVARGWQHREDTDYKGARGNTLGGRKFYYLDFSGGHKLY